MPEAYKETTVWVDSPSTINHTYLLEGDKMIAYMRSQTSIPFYFKTPIRIDKRGRKFELVEPNPFLADNIPQIVLCKQETNVKEVEGSKGNKYIINLDEKTCTCPGFTYRGTCKHTKELETI
jgi:hypothetical protein